MADPKRYVELIGEDLGDTVEKELYEKRVIVFNDDVDEWSITDLMKKILLLDLANHRDITILFNSNGGYEYECLALYDFMRSIKSKVHIQVTARAFSAGCFIVACCATGKRICGPSSSFMYHSGWAEGLMGKVDDILLDAKEMLRVENKLNEIFPKHTKVTKEELDTKFKNNIWFDAKQAKRWGIIDTVRRPRK